jgi:hypothetical protein
MEHALHLAAKHFVESVAPTSANQLLQKVKGAMANATENGAQLNMDVLNSEIEDIEAELGDKVEDKDDDDYNVADTIGKALALVAQV